MTDSSQQTTAAGAEKIQLKPGDLAPDFTLPDADGSEVSLASYRGKRVIVYFYPAASTPGCTVEACDFRDNLRPLQAANGEVLGISPDTPDKLQKFRAEQALTFPLLSDPERRVLLAYGAWGEKNSYGKKIMGVIRSTFLVGPDGRIEQAFYGVRAAGHVEKVLTTMGIG
ncbi:MAG: thioredoxin-dependent thiol peroxidase [Frankiaceae bacterium]